MHTCCRRRAVCRNASAAPLAVFAALQDRGCMIISISKIVWNAREMEEILVLVPIRLYARSCFLPNALGPAMKGGCYTLRASLEVTEPVWNGGAEHRQSTWVHDSDWNISVGKSYIFVFAKQLWYAGSGVPIVAFLGVVGFDGCCLRAKVGVIRLLTIGKSVELQGREGGVMAQRERRTAKVTAI